MKRTKIGIIGCGAISGAYLSQCPKFEILEVAACADLLMERTQARAAEFNVPRACSVAELLADPEIAIVVNLTIPIAHFDVAMAAVQAGKSVWNEKPLTITPRARAPIARRRAGQRRAGRLRAGHLPRRRWANLPQTHR